MLKQQKGITLVALVITIVILIILAGVAISLTISDNGLFNQAKDAKEQYQHAANEENAGFTNVLGYVNDTLKDQ